MRVPKEPAGRDALTQSAVQRRADCVLQQQIDSSPRQQAQRSHIAQLRGEPQIDAPANNRTGMPDQLKQGIESLSGMDMSDVQVHRNSDKPAQLNALAYAQGNDIHLGPGQEEHLPHEAWHVVQQRQGRVKPTMQMKGGVPVNDDAGLEQEADVMGERAFSVGQRKVPADVGNQSIAKVPSAAIKLAQLRPYCHGAGMTVVQRQVKISSVTADLPKTVATALKDAGLPQKAFGVSTKASNNYYRPKEIKGKVINGKVAADDQGNATTGVGSAEIGGLGTLESMTFGYGPVGDHDFAGGHLFASQFWTSAGDSLTEENLVPMRSELNGSLYKIMEGEIGAYVGGGSGNIGVEITCIYSGAKTIQLSNAGPLLEHLERQGVDINDDNKFDKTQSITVEPRVPYKISAKVITYGGNPDLPQRTFDSVGPTDIKRSKSYNKPGYVNGIGWKASDSETRPTVSSPHTVWEDFDPVRLKSAGDRTYDFYQQARP